MNTSVFGEGSPNANATDTDALSSGTDLSADRSCMAPTAATKPTSAAATTSATPAGKHTATASTATSGRHPQAARNQVSFCA